MDPDTIYTPGDLAPLDALSSLVWIVDLDRGVQWWANLACLPLWGAATREELPARSATNVPSETSRTRLEALRRRFEQGHRSTDRWTLYPDHAPPFVSECRSSGIRVADRRGDPGKLAMLIEARLLSADGAEDQLYASFVDPAQAAAARERLAAGAVFRADVRVRTLDGERWFDTEARPTLDPVTGEVGVLVTQRDVAERRAHTLALEQQGRQLAEQAETLRRLAAPVIRVGVGVLALPLIGPLDRERVEVGLAALLARIAREPVVRVVLDLTGAAAVDATVAAGLLHVVRVLQLQGVTAALSGVRPELARQISLAGLDLAGVPCFQSLEHALRPAHGPRGSA